MRLNHNFVEPKLEALVLNLKQKLLVPAALLPSDLQLAIPLEDFHTDFAQILLQSPLINQEDVSLTRQDLILLLHGLQFPFGGNGFGLHLADSCYTRSHALDLVCDSRDPGSSLKGKEKEETVKEGKEIKKKYK